MAKTAPLLDNHQTQATIMLKLPAQLRLAPQQALHDTSVLPFAVLFRLCGAHPNYMYMYRMGRNFFGLKFFAAFADPRKCICGWSLYAGEAILAN